MKKILKNLRVSSLCFLLSFAIFEHGYANNAGAPQSFVYGTGSIVGAWVEVDTNYFTAVIGKTGSVSTDPSTWVSTDLSSGLPNILQTTTNPALFSNAKGDAVVLFEYLDTNFQYWLVAATILSGTTNWIVQIISDINTSASGQDGSISFDENGNALALWSAYDSTTDQMLILSSIGNLYGTPSPTWSTPTVLSSI